MGGKKPAIFEATFPLILKCGHIPISIQLFLLALLHRSAMSLSEMKPRTRSANALTFYAECWGNGLHVNLKCISVPRILFSLSTHPFVLFFKLEAGLTPHPSFERMMRSGCRRVTLHLHIHVTYLERLPFILLYVRAEEG